MCGFKINHVLLSILSLFLLSSCTNWSSSANNGNNNLGVNDSSNLSFQKQKILDYLTEIKGKHVLGGIHNREPNSNPAQWTNEIFKLTGHYPALWSGDFLFQQDNIENRTVMIDEVINQYRQGALVNIMWHACNPAYDQPCEWDNGKGVLSALTDEQWEQLFVKGTSIHTQFINRMDEIALHLQRLKDNQVVALFRPFHEMNQGKFWWGGRPGSEGTSKLYRLIHDYLVLEKGLDNLIWVWNIQDFPTLNEDVDQYNPGDEYWDIVTLDVYDDATSFSKAKYESIKRVAAGKPMGIGECQQLPSVETLDEQVDWIFFMGWSELVFEHNSNDSIKSIYNSDRVLMLNELTGFKTGV